MRHAVLLACLALAAACGGSERPAPASPPVEGVETPEPACSTPGRRDDAGRPIPQC